MTFQSWSAEVDLANIYKVFFFETISKFSAVYIILNFKKRFPPIRLEYVIEVNWERGTWKTPYRD